MKNRIKQCAVVLSLFFVGCATEKASSKTNTVTLARHETVATFVGTNYQQCLGMTALCPDQCGLSGTFATFNITQYLVYEKLGEYGDPKSEQFVFMVEDNMKHAKVPNAIRSTVNSLKKGDAVLLSWNHDYVTIDGSSGPERPITKLELIAKE